MSFAVTYNKWPSSSSSRKCWIDTHICDRAISSDACKLGAILDNHIQHTFGAKSCTIEWRFYIQFGLVNGEDFVVGGHDCRVERCKLINGCCKKSKYRCELNKRAGAHVHTQNAHLMDEALRNARSRKKASVVAVATKAVCTLPPRHRAFLTLQKYTHHRLKCLEQKKRS